MSLYTQGLMAEQSKLRAAEHETLRARALAMRAEGLTFSIIATRLGCGETRVKRLLQPRAWREAGARP